MITPKPMIARGVLPYTALQVIGTEWADAKLREAPPKSGYYDLRLKLVGDPVDIGAIASLFMKEVTAGYQLDFPKVMEGDDYGVVRPGAADRLAAWRAAQSISDRAAA